MPDLRLDRIRFDAKNNESSPKVLRSKETWKPLLNHHTYPLVNVYIATENDPVETVDFPMKHGDFP